MFDRVAELRVLLATRGQDRREVEDHVGLDLTDHVLHACGVGDVEVMPRHVEATSSGLAATSLASTTWPRRPKLRDQLDADLPACAGEERLHAGVVSLVTGFMRERATACGSPRRASRRSLRRTSRRNPRRRDARMATVPASASRSPMTRMYGTLRIAISRIFLPSFVFDQSTAARSRAAFILARAAFRRFRVAVLTDGRDHACSGASPQGERARVVLDEDAGGALDRAEDRAVDDDGTLARAVLGNVLALELRRQREVELDRAELVEAADGILHIDVDLGP